MSTLLVFLGAGLGGALRHGVNIWALRFGTSFPWATFTVNVLGSLAMGLLMGLLLRRGGGEPWRLFLGTGVLGGFTTFSAFSLDLATLIDRGALITALAYAVGSVALSLIALYAGFVLARAVGLTLAMQGRDIRRAVSQSAHSFCKDRPHGQGRKSPHRQISHREEEFRPQSDDHLCRHRGHSHAVDVAPPADHTG